MTQFVKALSLRVIDILRRLFLVTIPMKVVAMKSDPRQEMSDSEKTPYLRCIESIAETPKLMNKFRRIFMYREIVETVTYAQGNAYLKRIRLLNENIIPDLHRFQTNDSVGKPITYRYSKSLRLSPTTLRYISVAQEIRKLFGSQLRGRFAEIGAGYGGQASILMQLFDISSYSIFDLHAAQEITSIYLNSFEKITSVEMCNLSESQSGSYDFVISNYAFSELPREIQDEYIIKVLQKSDRGYLIMNSGNTNYTGRQDGKNTINELRKKLPAFEIFEELPRTGPDNYVIVWGHMRKEI